MAGGLRLCFWICLVLSLVQRSVGAVDSHKKHENDAAHHHIASSSARPEMIHSRGSVFSWDRAGPVQGPGIQGRRNQSDSSPGHVTYLHRDSMFRDPRWSRWVQPLSRCGAVLVLWRAALDEPPAASPAPPATVDYSTPSATAGGWEAAPKRPNIQKGVISDLTVTIIFSYFDTTLNHLKLFTQ